MCRAGEKTIPFHLSNNNDDSVSSCFCFVQSCVNWAGRWDSFSSVVALISLLCHMSELLYELFIVSTVWRSSLWSLKQTTIIKYISWETSALDDLNQLKEIFQFTVPRTTLKTLWVFTFFLFYSTTFQMNLYFWLHFIYMTVIASS